ncbi:MAG: hypothetical protein ACXWWN_09630 [Gemmatimonadales bacterium]
MTKLLILAAVAALSTACANRAEDDTGAAPKQGDATVTATDSAPIPTDSTMGQRPGTTDTSLVRQDDTTSMSEPMPTQGDSALTNQATPDGDMGAMSDTTSINSTVPDTTARQ